LIRLYIAQEPIAIGCDPSTTFPIYLDDTIVQCWTEPWMERRN